MSMNDKNYESRFAHSCRQQLCQIHFWFFLTLYRFVYASSGRSPSYVNWLSHQPDNAVPWRNEDCVEVASWGWKWNDEHCSHLRPFACQKYKFSFHFLWNSSNEVNHYLWFQIFKVRISTCEIFEIKIWFASKM